MNEKRPLPPSTPVAEDFARWQGNSGIELADLMGRAAELAIPELVEVLAANLGERWAKGERPGIDEYLERYPALNGDPSSVGFLAVVECNCRAKAGFPPVPDSYFARFPDAADDFLELRQEWETGQGPDILGYSIEREIARGGMGVVYEAWEHELKRRVAIKVLRFEDADDRVRFETEAQAIAALRHPNIVTIYRIDKVGDRPFLCLEYVEGVSLSQRLAGEPQPPTLAAALVRVLAGAVQHAHDRGIVHRDLKPSNILLSGAEAFTAAEIGLIAPKITDFGLAKHVDADSGLTTTGAIIGTPSYMAPEQARGENSAVGPLADVYALGAILYECLTGRPPFKGSTQIETILRVGDEFDDPIPPSQLVKIPTDLETICLKCLAKVPGKRYATAQALAEDLARFLADEPIQGRRTPPLDRAVKWVRRKPYRALLTLAVVSLVIAAIAVPLGIAHIESGNAKEQAGLRRQADLARREAEVRAADARTTTGLALTDQGKHAQGVLWFANAALGAREDPQRRRLNLVRARTTLRLVPVPVAAIRVTGLKPQQMIFHPDGNQLLVQTEEGCLVYDLGDEEQRKWPCGDQQVVAAGWSPDGTRCALVTSPTELAIHHLPTGRLSARLPITGPVEAVVFSPDGRTLAAAGSSVRLWDCRQDPPVAVATWDHPAAVRAVVFSGYGRVATSCADGKARVFDVGTEPGNGEPLFTAAHEGFEHGEDSPPAFFRNGTGLVTRTGWTGLRWWDIETKQELFAVETTHDIVRVVPSPDGRHAGVLHFGGADYWDLDQHQQVGERMTHDNFGRGGAFSPDGRVFLTVSDDRTARLWSVPDGSPLAGWQYHEGHATVAAFSPTGHLFATSQDDGLIRVWRLPDHLSMSYLLPVRDDPVFAAVSSGFFLPSGTHRDDAQLLGTSLHHVETGTTAGQDAIGLLSVIVGGAVDPQAERVLILSKEPHAATFWRTKPALQRLACEPLPSQPLGAAFGLSGKLAVVLCRGGEVLRFDPATGKRLGQPFHHPGSPDLAMFLPARWVCFAADDSRFATWGLGKSVCVWDSTTGNLMHFLEHGDLCFDADFSGSDRLVTASRDKTARVWVLEANKAREIQAWEHPDWVFCVRFSQGGQRVLTACRDFSARIFDTADGREAVPSMWHRNEVYSAVFTPNGKLVVTAGRDRSARVWDGATGGPLTPPWALPGWGLQVTVSPDGQWAVIGGFTKGIQVFSLSDLVDDDLGAVVESDFDIDGWNRLGELVSGQEITDRSTTLNIAARNLNSREWIKRWADFRNRYPSERRLELTPSQQRDWHRREAVAAERSLAWYGAVWHYERALGNREGESWEYGRRGNAYAELARWDEALRDYRRAAASGPKDLGFWRSYALVHLGAADQAGYREACREIIRRFGSSGDPTVVDALTEVCSLAPLDSDEAAEFRSIAERAVQRDPDRWEFRQSLGIALYRSGESGKAIEELTKANDLTPEKRFFTNDFYLALAYHCQGDALLAREHLTRANDMMQEVDRAIFVRQLRLSWENLLEWRIAQMEAESALAK